LPVGLTRAPISRLVPEVARAEGIRLNSGIAEIGACRLAPFEANFNKATMHVDT
jgi:hypothetical protein